MVQRTASSNKQLARQERDEALMEIAKGSFIPFSYTVKEFYDFWFYHYMIGQKRITYNTYNAYRNIIENYLLPAIGHKMLNTLQRKDLVNAYLLSRIRKYRELQSVWSQGPFVTPRNTTIFPGISIPGSLPK